MLPEPSVQPDSEQVGAAALYTTPVSYLEEVNQEYKKRRDTIVAALKELPGVVASDPKGAFYIMVQLPVDDAEKVCYLDFGKFCY